MGLCSRSSCLWLGLLLGLHLLSLLLGLLGSCFGSRLLFCHQRSSCCCSTVKSKTLQQYILVGFELNSTFAMQSLVQNVCTVMTDTHENEQGLRLVAQD